MTPATRQEVLGLYRRVLRIARTWQSASGQAEETMREKEYIRNEARTLFRKNRNVSVLMVLNFQITLALLFALCGWMLR